MDYKLLILVGKNFGAYANEIKSIHFENSNLAADFFKKNLPENSLVPVSYTHLRAHETVLDLVCRLLLEKKKQQENINKKKTEKNTNTTRQHSMYILKNINTRTAGTSKTSNAQ